MKQSEKFLTRFMNKLADFIGTPKVFAVVVLLVLGWFVAKLFVPYDAWYDVMDLTIFISTFFLLFVLQNSQNADTQAMQDKLDELIDSIPKANKQKESEEKRLKKGEKK